jgi:hypothetical protein
MTAPIRQRIPLAASDARVIVRRGAARHDRAVAAAAVPPPKPRHAGCGPIPLPRLSAHDHDDVTVVRLHDELDPSGTAVLHAQLRDIRWRAQARSVADLTGLPVPGRASLSMPARRCKPIRDRVGNLAPGGPQAPTIRGALSVTGMLSGSRRMTAPGMPSLALGQPDHPGFPRSPSNPRSRSRRNSAHRRRQVRYRSWTPRARLGTNDAATLMTHSWRAPEWRHPPALPSIGPGARHFLARSR